WVRWSRSTDAPSAPASRGPSPCASSPRSGTWPRAKAPLSTRRPAFRPRRDPRPGPCRGLMRRPVASRRVYTGRHISLRLDELEFPNRHRVVYELVEHRGAAAMVALTGDRRLLLVREFRPGLGEELVEIPARTIEDGVPLEPGARRDLAVVVGHDDG